MILWAFGVVAGGVAGLLRPRPKGPASVPDFRFLHVILPVGLAAAVISFVPPVWGRFLFWAELALMLLLIWANRHIPALRLLMAGALLNGLAILAAGGHMPVKGSDRLLAEAGVRHGPLQGSLFDWLGDWIKIPILFKPPPNRVVASPGDLIIAASIAWLVSDLVVWLRSAPTSVHGGDSA